MPQLPHKQDVIELSLHGEIVTTHYNNNMLPIDVIGANTYVSSMTYDSASRLRTRALGNGLTQTYDYYAWNQQGGRLHTLATGSLQNYSYNYDSVGNITSITDSIHTLTQSFGYDELDRLTNASASGETWQGAYSETYQYDPATGNLHIKGGVTLDYLDSSHAHAVTNANSNTYAYDSNGNQTTRNIGQDTFNLIYDAEHRLVEVKKNSATIAQFTFDGDGARVKSVMDGETILFVGSHFEQKGSTITKYYMAGASRIAMRKYTIPQSMEVEYMLGDHLGSTSVTTDSNGTMVSEIRYKPWGETRYTSIDAPANTSPAYELVKYQFTGQFSYDIEFGLKYYNARWLDSTTGRFVQADTVVPPGVQGYDRYAYTRNNPVRYTDPSGHMETEGCGEDGKEKCHASDLEIARNAQHLASLLYDPTGKKQKRNAKIAETIFGGTELLASVLFEPADWAMTLYDCANGDCSVLALIFMVTPVLSGKTGGVADDAIQTFWKSEFVKYPNSPYAILGYSEDAYQEIGRGLQGTFLWSSKYGEYVSEFGRDAFWKNINEPFVREVIDQGKDVFLATPLSRILADGAGVASDKARFAFREIQMLLTAGYTPSGSWLIAPSVP